MSDSIAKVLAVALAFDALANLARVAAIEIAYRRQVKLIARQELEVERRIEAAAAVVAETARAVAEEMGADR